MTRFANWPTKSELGNVAREIAEIFIPCLIVGVTAAWFSNKPVEDVVIRDATGMCFNNAGLKEFKRDFFSFHVYTVQCKDGAHFLNVHLRAMTIAEIKAQDEEYRKQQEEEFNRIEREKEKALATARDGNKK